MPEQLQEIYLSGEAARLGWLPLSTGREWQAPQDSSSCSFEDNLQRFASVLGYAIGNAALASHSPEDCWPTGLLVVEDVGCGITRAVDLDHSEFRMVEHQALDPVADPELAAGDARLAYVEPTVPRCLQHRFTVLADSLADWLRRESNSQP